MYSRLANKFACFLILHFQSDNENDLCKNVQVISYGIEIILSSIMNLLLVFVLGSCLWGWIETLVFILLFCPIRQFSGGYHAKTHLLCTIGFLTLFFLVGKFVYTFADFKGCIFMCIICIFIIGIVSPVDTRNKRMSECAKKNCRKKVIIILSIEIIIILSFGMVLRLRFIQAATVALLVECFLLGLGKCVNKGWR